VLINGLAEQAESWYCNTGAWRQHFDVYQPNLLVYDGAALHRRIETGQPIDIEYLVGHLHEYLDGFVQTPPYHLVANSLGGKVAVEFAVRYPISSAGWCCCASQGCGTDAGAEGVRRSDARAAGGECL
jgi:pimeloyl-ACP methyl ester carboxylesterase